MKTYKLKGLDYYIIAFSKSDAVAICWINHIGVTENNIIETDIVPNRESIGKLFRSLDELNSFDESEFE